MMLMTMDVGQKLAAAGTPPTTQGVVSAGDYHTMLLKHDGTVWASGFNDFGQLGDGGTTYRRTPVPVMTGVLSVSAGSVHTAFLKQDGTVWASGCNYYGQL